MVTGKDRRASHRAFQSIVGRRHLDVHGSAAARKNAEAEVERLARLRHVDGIADRPFGRCLASAFANLEPPANLRFFISTSMASRRSTTRSDGNGDKLQSRQATKTTKNSVWDGLPLGGDEFAAICPAAPDKAMTLRAI